MRRSLIVATGLLAAIPVAEAQVELKNCADANGYKANPVKSFIEAIDVVLKEEGSQ